MRLLIVPGFSKESGSANWNCLEEIIEALKSAKVECDITGDVLKNQAPTINWKTHPFYMCKKIVKWPVIDPILSDECYQRIINQLSTKRYDALLVSHMPYDAVLAAVKAKRQFPDVKLMLYELDPITYEIDKKRKSFGRNLYFLRERAEKKTYDNCDIIIHMECNRTKYSASRYLKYTDKSIFLDFPLVHNNAVSFRAAKEYNNEKIKLIYTGKLMTHFRSPEYLLKVIACLHEYVDVEASFYTNGNCESLIREYTDKYPFIYQKGFVDKNTLELAVDESDCLINIGNKISAMLPSKLLTYIETGKPILHVQNQKNDSCVEYLNRYSLSVIINEDDPVDESVRKIVEFIKNRYNERLGSDYIIDRFITNTPEYSAEQIVKLLNNKE